MVQKEIVATLLCYLSLVSLAAGYDVKSVSYGSLRLYTLSNYLLAVGSAQLISGYYLLARISNITAIRCLAITDTFIFVYGITTVFMLNIKYIGQGYEVTCAFMMWILSYFRVLHQLGGVLNRTMLINEYTRQ